MRLGSIFHAAVLAALTATPALGAAPTAPARATTAPTVRASSVEGALHAAPAGLGSAEALLKALTHRVLDLQQRPSAPAVGTDRTSASAVAHPTRLASRLSAPAARRTREPFAPAADLAAYVAIESRTKPGAFITGRFNDWRSPSIYRLFGGRHNGYDVALPAGTPAVAGWPGRVTAITWWAGREYGITVVSPDGFHTTYGHLAPSVRIGAWVEPGDVVGIVVRDHVDVKMKDAHNRPIDFGKGVPLANRPAPAATVAAPPVPVGLPTLAGPAWTMKPDAVRAALAYVRFRVQEATLLATPDTSATTLALVRRQVAEARTRIVLHGVPEGLLLAAFMESPALQSGNFSMGDAGGDPVAGVDLLGDWLHRQSMLTDARRSETEFKALLKDLDPGE